MNTNKEFFRLFFKRELGPLLGKGQSNLLALILMLFTTFTVIGFAEGSLRYLEQKMKDPFINWVTVLPGGASSWVIDRVLYELNTEGVRREYGLKNAIGYNRFLLNFYSHDDIMNYYATGSLDTNRITGFSSRTLELQDPVMEEIFSGGNLVEGTGPSNNTDIGLVVTSEMLRRLGYPTNTPYVWMDMPVLKPGPESIQSRAAIPVPVRGVVRALPGLAGFASTPYFYQQRSMRIGNNPFNPMYDHRMVLTFFGSEEEAGELTGRITERLNESLLDFRLSLGSVWSEPRYNGGDPDHHMVFITFRERDTTPDEMDEVFLYLYNNRDLSPFREKIFRLYDYHRKLSGLHPTGDYDRISLNFANLDRLREFSVMLFERHNIEVDMVQIESRENYNFVSRLTGIISLVLIVFSILSILLFVGHLLKKHLEGIKRNLGTFKAFGLSNHLIINTYVQLVLFILGIGACIALMASALFGYLGGMRLLLMVFAAHFEPGRYFSLFSSYLLVAILMLSVSAIFSLYFITNRILNQTPGDLIYERQ